MVTSKGIVAAATVIVLVAIVTVPPADGSAPDGSRRPSRRDAIPPAVPFVSKGSSSTKLETPAQLGAKLQRAATAAPSGAYETGNKRNPRKFEKLEEVAEFPGAFNPTGPPRSERNTSNSANRVSVTEVNLNPSALNSTTQTPKNPNELHAAAGASIKRAHSTVPGSAAKPAKPLSNISETREMFKARRASSNFTNNRVEDLTSSMMMSALKDEPEECENFKTNEYPQHLSEKTISALHDLTGGVWNAIIKYVTTPLKNRSRRLSNGDTPRSGFLANEVESIKTYDQPDAFHFTLDRVLRVSLHSLDEHDRPAIGFDNAPLGVKTPACFVVYDEKNQRLSVTYYTGNPNQKSKKRYFALRSDPNKPGLLLDLLNSNYQLLQTYEKSPYSPNEMQPSQSHHPTGAGQQVPRHPDYFGDRPAPYGNYGHLDMLPYNSFAPPPPPPPPPPFYSGSPIYHPNHIMPPLPVADPFKQPNYSAPYQYDHTTTPPHQQTRSDYFPPNQQYSGGVYPTTTLYQKSTQPPYGDHSVYDDPYQQQADPKFNTYDQQMVAEPPKRTAKDSRNFEDSDDFLPPDFDKRKQKQYGNSESRSSRPFRPSADQSTGHPHGPPRHESRGNPRGARGPPRPPSRQSDNRKGF